MAARPPSEKPAACAASRRPPPPSTSSARSRDSAGTGRPARSAKSTRNDAPCPATASVARRLVTLHWRALRVWHTDSGTERASSNMLAVEGDDDPVHTRNVCNPTDGIRVILAVAYTRRHRSWSTDGDHKWLASSRPTPCIKRNYGKVARRDGPWQNTDRLPAAWHDAGFAAPAAVSAIPGASG